MDHSEAVKLGAVERYVLGGLSEELRERFEEHYFDCAECSRDLQALTTFVTASRMSLEEKPLAPSPLQREPQQQSGWFSWFRPAVAVPAFSILAALLIYQNAVLVPSLKEQVSAGRTAQAYEISYFIQGASRGEEVSKITIQPGETFALDFHFTPSQTFPEYKGSLVDSSGNSALMFHIRGSDTNKELHLVVPAGTMRPGNYALVVLADSNKPNSDAVEVQRLNFAVALSSASK
jgi:hypothetical protein